MLNNPVDRTGDSGAVLVEVSTKLNRHYAAGHQVDMFLKQTILISCLLLLVGCENPGDGRESFGDKNEWSIIQNIEYSNRDKKNLSFKIVEENKYYIALIPDNDGTGYISIMLNPQSAPFYKQLPSKQFDLTEIEFKKILETQKMISTVEEALSSHLRK